MDVSLRALVGSALALILGAGTAAAQADQPPAFRSSVDVTPIDVTVVDRSGRPITDLAATAFTVTVDGRARRVVDAEWVSLATPAHPDVAPPAGYSTNATSTGGRLILIVVDQPNIRFGGALGIQRAVNGFIDRLQPSDRIAAVGIGPGSPSTPFTADRSRVKTAISRMAGQRASAGTVREYYVSVSEAMAIRRTEPGALERAVARECAGIPVIPPGEYEFCVAGVQSEAMRVSQDSAADANQTIASLRAILTGLRTIDLPKTLILVSEGFVMDERYAEVTEIGALASAARTSIYALKLDDQAFDMADARAGAAQPRFQDRLEREAGIATLTGAARGQMFNIAAGADAAFARIESELSGYYLLGIESIPADADGQPHRIKVEVKRPGVQVRSRREIVTAPGGDSPLPPRQAVMAALGSPLIVSALPLRVATFSLQGPDSTKVQLLIHAAVGSDYAASRSVSFAYQISNGEGRVVDGLGGDIRLQPVMNGVPSGLQYTGSASLAPGEYTLKLAVAEGERIGTVEHTFQASLVDAESHRLSDLMVGGPPDMRRLLRPTVGHTVAFGTLHGYIEGYGTEAGSLKAKFEVAPAADRPALLTAEVPGETAGDSRVIFSHMMAVRQLPPGPYLLRATVSSPAGAIKTLTRDFEIGAPAVLMTSADAGAAPPPVRGDLYLPVGDELFARRFELEEATGGEVLRVLRSRVSDRARPAFDRGVAQLAEGNYPKAESSFKEAIEADADSTAVLAYLAASFAASGHDTQAAGAWQTALIDGSDVPEIYAWLGDALMRTRDLPQARAVLDEAAKKWPADVRFAKPLALLYATFGEGREALRSLARHLEAHADDTDAMALGVEWIYQLHTAGTVARTQAEDLKLARTYAEAYTRAKGPQVALVNRWIEFLESRH